jgi:hypothetical protein
MKYYVVMGVLLYVIIMNISYTTCQYTPIQRPGYCAIGGISGDKRTPLVRNLPAWNYTEVIFLPFPTYLPSFASLQSDCYDGCVYV